jgi:hypothetical protein
MKIITSVVNNVNFIEIQYYTFRKFIRCSYEFIVFNDAKTFSDITNGGDLTIKQKIEDKCNELNITCINIDNDHHCKYIMSERHVDTFNKYLIPFQMANPDKYLIIDSDMFLIDFFDERVLDYSCGVIEQMRENIVYIWPGLCYMDFNKILNIELLNWACSPGLDSGGMMKEWLSKQKEGGVEHIHFIRSLSSCCWRETDIPENLRENKNLLQFLKEDPRNSGDTFFCEIYDGRFLHYRAGSNWMCDGMEKHNALSKKLKQLLLNEFNEKKENDEQFDDNTVNN